jgi:hypothetical protein
VIERGPMLSKQGRNSLYNFAEIAQTAGVVAVAGLKIVQLSPPLICGWSRRTTFSNELWISMLPL